LNKYFADNENSKTNTARITQMRLESLAFAISEASNFETMPSALLAEMEEFTSLSQIGASSDGLSTCLETFIQLRIDLIILGKQKLFAVTIYIVVHYLSIM